ncbi:MAG: cupin domain-containing protein [Pseudomonadota bacterium]
MIDPATVRSLTGSTYPEPHASAMGDRSFQELGEAGGLTDFGAVLVTMPPETLSSLRHWHTEEDEFACVLEGELTLVEDDGPTIVGPGSFIAWAKGSPNGHRLENRSGAVARFLVIGSRSPTDVCVYSDVDLAFHAAEGGRFTRRGGAPLTDGHGDTQ